MLVSGLIIALALGLVEATPVANLKRRAGYAVKESIHLPRDWHRLGDVSGEQEVVFSIGLKQRAFDELERQLYEVSDPDHESFGNHLNQDQVHSLIRPSEETLGAVHDWLLLNGISRDRLGYSSSSDWVNIKLNISDAEALLDTKFGNYQHKDGTEYIRTLEYSIPAELHGHIDTIQPTNSFLRTKRRHTDHHIVGELGSVPANVKTLAAPAKTDGSVFAACGDGTKAITPNCLRTLYGTIDYKVQCPENNKIGVNDFLGEINNRSDAKIFLSKYRKDIDAAKAAQSFKQVSIAGGTVQQTPLNATQLAAGTGLEGNLDIETVLGISYPTRVTAYSTGGSPPFIPDARTDTNSNEPYLTWVQYMSGLKDKDLPSVVTTSYGDDEQTVPQSYAKRVCEEFAHLGARGVSLFFASGDNGVGPDGLCLTNDGKNTRKFLPEFPGSCPYVTSVGATQLVSPNNTVQPEIAARDEFSDGTVFTSGAGFSNYFPRPSYQKNTIAKYLKSIGNTNKGLFNPNGRAYPDISANGQGYAVAWNGTLVVLDGTSASTPAMASIFGLVNDALIAQGKKKLGFLNVWLYKTGYKAFKDITIGGSDGCNSTGFRAQPGWDAVTGFGTPQFSKILELAKCK